MKKNLCVTMIMMFVLNLAFSQSNCSKFYPLEEGTSFQYTLYDKKGKPDGVTDYTVSDVSDVSGSTTATMQLKFTDKKGKEVYNTDYSFTCTGSGIKIDFNSLLPSTMLEQYEGMDYEITGTDIEIPNELSVGQELEDANMNMAISMAGMSVNITVNNTNRKVEKKESVTTPAGTFDCFVIYGDTEAKVMGSSHTSPSEPGMVEGSSVKRLGSMSLPAPKPARLL